MKYRTVAELYRNFTDELTKIVSIRKMVMRIEKQIGKRLCWSEV